LTPSPAGPALFEYDKERLSRAFPRRQVRRGRVVSEVFERDLFSFLRSQRLLTELAESYPTPREKEEVPVWFYLGADVAMRLQWPAQLPLLPLVVRSGGLLSLLVPKRPAPH